MKIVRQKKAEGDDAFSLRVWRKDVYSRGWYAKIKIGGREWMIVPSKYEVETDEPKPHVVQVSRADVLAARLKWKLDTMTDEETSPWVKKLAKTRLPLETKEWEVTYPSERQMRNLRAGKPQGPR